MTKQVFLDWVFDRQRLLSLKARKDRKDFANSRTLRGACSPFHGVSYMQGAMDAYDHLMKLDGIKSK